jgi:hypothetical protein
VGRGLALRWMHGEKRAPFQVTLHDSAARLMWNARGTVLWTAPPQAPSAERRLWSAWDPSTGRRLRRATVPDDTRMRVPDPADVERVVGRDRAGRPERWIVAWSVDASRVLTSPTHFDSVTLRSLDGVVDELSDLHRPATFSPDGQRVVAALRGERTLAIVRASDGDLVDFVACPIRLSSLTSLVWTRRNILVVNCREPRGEDRLYALSLDEGRVLWDEPGYFVSIAADETDEIAAGIHVDGSVHLWDLASGAPVMRLAKDERPRGPILCGEPDIRAMIAALARRPIAFTAVTPIRSVRHGGGVVEVVRDPPRRTLVEASSGEPLAERPMPWDPLDDREIERALAALARPADGAQCAAVSADGGFAVFYLRRDEHEVPDPDAGSVWRYDPALALWDRRAASWRWETAEHPEGYVLAFLDQFTLSFDESGLFVRGSSYPTSGTLYDVETGALRLAREGDRPKEGPWSAPDVRLLAASRGGLWALAARGARLELWNLEEVAITGTVDFDAADDEPVVAAFVDDGPSFVVGTAYSSVMRFDAAL